MPTIKDLILPLLTKFLEWRKTNPKLSIFAIFITLGYLYHRSKKYIYGKRALQNKIVLITGGVSGIGRQTALLLKGLNATVIVWDINKDGLEDMKTKVDMALFVDITVREKVEEAAKIVLDEYKNGVDILINNAGIVIGKNILDLTEPQIRKCFDVNIISHFWMIQAFLPKMMTKSTWCHIVSVSSSAGKIGCPQLSDYCATKFAVRGLTDALWAELYEEGLTHIGTSTIMPYFINTGMFDGVVASKRIFMRLFGCYFLDQDYVARQIVRAIQYNIRNVILPRELSVICSWEHWLPDGLKDFLLNLGPSMHKLKGRNKPNAADDSVAIQSLKD